MTTYKALYWVASEEENGQLHGCCINSMRIRVLMVATPTETHIRVLSEA